MNHIFRELDFVLPQPYIDFFEHTVGYELSKGDKYIALYPVDNVIEFNKRYEIEKNIPSFFLIGSNGGDEAIMLHKETGAIYEVPFIGMDKKEAVLKWSSFKELLLDMNGLDHPL